MSSAKKIQFEVIEQLQLRLQLRQNCESNPIKNNNNNRSLSVGRSNGQFGAPNSEQTSEHKQILQNTFKDIQIYINKVISLLEYSNNISDEIRDFIEKAWLHYNKYNNFFEENYMTVKLPEFLNQLESTWESFELSIVKLNSSVTDKEITDILTTKSDISNEDLNRINDFLDKVKLATLVCIKTFKELEDAKYNTFSEVLKLERICPPDSERHKISGRNVFNIAKNTGKGIKSGVVGVTHLVAGDVVDGVVNLGKFAVSTGGVAVTIGTLVHGQVKLSKKKRMIKRLGDLVKQVILLDTEIRRLEYQFVFNYKHWIPVNWDTSDVVGNDKIIETLQLQLQQLLGQNNSY